MAQLQFSKIKAPVGAGRSSAANAKPIENDPSDVTIIQDFLRQISSEEGGTPGLVANGKISGPNDPTVQAIKKFQRIQLGFFDGVVDPGQKTEAALHEAMRRQLGPQPDDPVITRKAVVDTVIRIMGQNPSAPEAGTETREGQGAIGVPSAAGFSAKVVTSDYTSKGFFLDLLNFFGGGGRANAASDPTEKIITKIRRQRKAAEGTSLTFRRMIVFGWSIGGRNAATVARRLKAEGITVDYLGLIDAAFDTDTDAERSAPVQASEADNIFQAVSNDLRSEFPEFEFHGAVSLGSVTQLETTDTFYRERKQKFDDEIFILPGARKKSAIRCMDDLHKKAVTVGHQTVEAKVIKKLLPD